MNLHADQNLCPALGSVREHWLYHANVLECFRQIAEPYLVAVAAFSYTLSGGDGGGNAWLCTGREGAKRKMRVLHVCMRLA